MCGAAALVLPKALRESLTVLLRCATFPSHNFPRERKELCSPRFSATGGFFTVGGLSPGERAKP